MIRIKNTNVYIWGCSREDACLTKEQYGGKQRHSPEVPKKQNKKRKLRVFYCVCLDISWIPNKSESAVKSGVKSLRRHEHHTSAALC